MKEGRKEGKGREVKKGRKKVREGRKEQRKEGRKHPREPGNIARLSQRVLLVARLKRKIRVASVDNDDLFTLVRGHKRAELLVRGYSCLSWFPGRHRARVGSESAVRQKGGTSQEHSLENR
jgi:hypothetical protein